jgi:hypothetical protein
MPLLSKKNNHGNNQLLQQERHLHGYWLLFIDFKN